MASEEVTNLTDEQVNDYVRSAERSKAGWGAAAVHYRNGFEAGAADALERSTAETREAQADAILRMADIWASGARATMRQDEIRKYAHDLRPVSSVVAEDPKPKECGALADNAMGMEARCSFDHGHDGRHDWEAEDPKPFTPLTEWADRQQKYYDGVTPKAGA
jgi:hypothetical protein